MAATEDGSSLPNCHTHFWGSLKRPLCKGKQKKVAKEPPSTPPSIVVCVCVFMHVCVCRYTYYTHGWRPPRHWAHCVLLKWGLELSSYAGLAGGLVSSRDQPASTSAGLGWLSAFNHAQVFDLGFGESDSNSQAYTASSLPSETSVYHLLR